MKKTIGLIIITIMAGNVANARDTLTDFSREVNAGIDMVGVRNGGAEPAQHESGVMGYEVYEGVSDASIPQWEMFIPTSAYVRMGGGINIDVATSKANTPNGLHRAEDSYTYQFGLGWNMSSYVRSEIGFQNSVFKFGTSPDLQATNQQGYLMLYFDLARRYVETGDVARRRTFIPFIGFGAGAGYYEFEGTHGANGVAFAAPRGEVGFTLMFTDLFGLDIAYQYQMMHNKGFGWNTDNHDTTHISNVVASLKFNF
ncbi:MAG: hypothetical protein KBS86_03310 [Proteobacteria bacterium]|nr:hypothetical protein [Candidatus Enterousia scatequi]